MATIKDRFAALQRYGKHFVKHVWHSYAGDSHVVLDPSGEWVRRDDVLDLAEQIDREQAPTQLGDLSTGIAESADKAMAEINANRESYVRAFVAETGILPSECMLVEQARADGSVCMWAARKPPTRPVPMSKRVK